MSHLQNKTTFIKILCEEYSESLPSRGTVAAIPVIGGALDAIMSGVASQIQQDRFYALVDALDKRMDEVEKIKEIEPSEELFDLFRVAIENTVRTRSDDKRKRFANIIANKVVSDDKSWDDAETAIRLVGELEDIHIEMLLVSNQAPVFNDPLSDNQRIVSLTQHQQLIEGDPTPVSVPAELPHYDDLRLHRAYIRLLSEGLIEPPTSIGGYIEKRDRNNDFVVTTLGKWLLDWIENS